MTIDLDKLEELARAAENPGPWRAHLTRANGYLILGVCADVQPLNAAHITANDPTSVLELIARVRLAEIECRKALEMHAEWRKEAAIVFEDLRDKLKAMEGRADRADEAKLAAEARMERMREAAKEVKRG